MKRILYVGALALLMLTSGMAVAQDLAAAARQQREQKKQSAKRVYTNEDIASGASTPAAEPAAADASKATAKDTKADKPKTEASADEKAKTAAALQAKIDRQKAELATLTRELDIADREFKLRAAAYYADAGNSLRDPKKWAEEQRAKQAEIEGKKKAIEDSKAKIADMQEQARKLGLKTE